MKKLSEDWFVEGLIDLEYKKYLLLAYLQQVSREFAEVKLYPSFSDLIAHYNNLHRFQTSKKKLFESFPTKLNEEELAKMRLVYQTDVSEEGEIAEIEAIISYAMPEIKTHLDDGKEIYDFIDRQLVISPIGISPLYKKEGYLLLKMENRNEIDAYEYKIIFFENINANYHGISLSHIDSFRKSIVNTYESIKLQLIRSHAKFPNPATFLVFSPSLLPKESTLLPVAKRKFLSYLC